MYKIHTLDESREVKSYGRRSNDVNNCDCLRDGSVSSNIQKFSIILALMIDEKSKFKSRIFKERIEGF